MSESVKMKKQNASPEIPQLEAELKRERYKQRYRKILKSTVYAIIIIAAIAALIATMVLPVLQITGISMEPTLYDGDIVVLVKTDNLKRGDLCSFAYSNKYLIKRVIGLPGDYIVVDKNGTVSVNGEVIDEPYVTEKSLGECDVKFPYQVPESHYFVMGDQRATSIDSRSSVIGCVSEEQLIGKLLVKIWPLTEITFDFG